MRLALTARRAGLKGHGWPAPSSARNASNIAGIISTDTEIHWREHWSNRDQTMKTPLLATQDHFLVPNPIFLLYDRYCLASSHCAGPDAVVVVASFAGSAETPIQIIKRNTPILLRTFPLLSAVVVDRATRDPRFAAAKHITANHIVDQEIQSATSLEHIFNHEHHRNNTELDPEQGPLWRVAFYENQSSKEPICYVALSCWHVINDGLGICELLRQLLRRPQINESIERSTPVGQFPPRIEDTIDLPLPWHWLRDSWLQSAASYLPSFLNAYPPPPPTWPVTVSKRPFESGVKRIVLEGDSNHPGWLGGGIKAFSKISGAGSVNSILHGAVAYSLYTAIKEHDKTLPSNLQFKTQTPISVRSSELGHPTTTGNYIIIAPFSFPASDLDGAKPDFTVTDLFRNYHTWIHSPTGRFIARTSAGLLRVFYELDLDRFTEWIPFYPSPKPKKLGNWIFADPPTAYERYCSRTQNLTLDAEGKADSPYTNSFQLSNTGLIKTGEWEDGLRESLKGIWWSQRPMPWGNFIYCDGESLDFLLRVLVGCEVLQSKTFDTDSAYSTASDSSGDEPAEVVHHQLGISLAWRDGVVDKEIMEALVENLKAMLNLIAATGHEGKLATSKIAELPIQDFGRRLKESIDGTEW
ncbi:uncharacterized protein MYCFIDRAFT_180530 [Pseudocercospora fijiensis CIRAD86]|uniref:Uncharacterized protein n=1 Tax=Pseudocercospora fijiensis (strain CIRAD86) TaxID=383855 RepID=M2YGD1_PSEFD|nr:uncharacterized protein MYCFIDRAFT_180530 [Pseudocercospora fijiensis CIRAD86]EME76865.1 hypothetical protein MYCFIDRAFT_180530 [Pseudocercospora fijiensis CIRAD86]